MELSDHLGLLASLLCTLFLHHCFITAAAIIILSDNHSIIIFAIIYESIAIYAFNGFNLQLILIILLAIDIIVLQLILIVL